MRSNFLFIKKNWRELYEVASLAENNVINDPNAALIKFRLYGELLVKHIFKYEGFVERNKMSQNERIDFLLKEGTITLEVYGMLDSLRVVGNKAVHEASYGTANESKRLLVIAFHIGGWLTQVYKEWDFELPVFREPQQLQAVISGNIRYTAILPKRTAPFKGNSFSNEKIFKFSNDEHGYEEWLKGNENGFVFNHYGGTEASKDMKKLHQSDCRYLHRKQDEGKRTTAYPKICSLDLRELEAQVVQLRGSSWVNYKNCHT
jgi:hypothetical protein